MIRALLTLALACGSASTPSTTPDTPEPVIASSPAPTEPEAPIASCIVSDVDSVLRCDDTELSSDCGDDLECHIEARERRSVTEGARELGPEERAFDAAARRQACADPTNAEALFWIARLRYDTNRFAEAVPLFDRVTEVNPSSEYATPSMDLALDAILLRSRQDSQLRVECEQTLIEAIARYRTRFCTAEYRHPRCENLDRLHCQANAHAAEALAEAQQHTAASTRYEELANDPLCEQTAPQMLFNAALMADRDGNGTRADELRTQLRQRFPDFPVP